MKLRTESLPEFMSAPELAALLRVSAKTVYRWRTEGRTIEARGRCEVIYLHSVNTSGARVRGGLVLVPVSHEEVRGGFRYLGAAEFVAALGVDPVLRHMEAGLLS